MSDRTVGQVHVLRQQLNSHRADIASLTMQMRLMSEDYERRLHLAELRRLEALATGQGGREEFCTCEGGNRLEEMRGFCVGCGRQVY